MSLYDSRYPHLVPVDGRPLGGLSHSDKQDAERIARAVAVPTGTKCFYNIITGKLLFVYGQEPVGGPLQIPFRGASGHRNYDGAGLTAMVEYIRLGKMSPTEKDRIAKQNEAAERQEKERLGQQFRDDVRPDVLAHAKFLSERRRGTQKVSVFL